MQSSSKPSVSTSDSSKAVQQNQPAQVTAPSPELQAKNIASSDESSNASVLSRLRERWNALSGDRILMTGLLSVLVLTMFLFANKGSNN